MAISVWTPADGFTRKTKPMAIKPVIVKPTVTEKPKPLRSESPQGGPAQPSKPKRRKPSERQRAHWLKVNQLKDRTIADDYLIKQAKTATPMMFVGYGITYLCTVVSVWRYDIDLTIEGRKKRLHKLDMALYYKAQDTEAVEKLLTFDSDAVTGRPRKKLSERDVVDLSALERGASVSLTLRTGHRLTGIVRWVTAYDVGLTLDNGAKVHCFKHAISTVNLNANKMP